MAENWPTLQDIFPGHLGRLALSTVVLRLRKPELLKMHMDEPIRPDLAATLKRELERMKGER